MSMSHARRSRRLLLVTAAAAAALLTSAVPQAHAQVIPPAVPANLEVQAGNTPFQIGHAYGSQNYICLLSEGGFQWTFVGPQATLFDDHDQQVLTHFLSANPDEIGALRATWQHSEDSSAVWAAAIANSTDSSFVADNAIPWLLLRVVGVEEGPTSGNALSATTFVQRVNTNGGLAPATGCRRADDIGRKAFVPYTADYVFYSH